MEKNKNIVSSQSIFIIVRDGIISISGGDYNISEWQFLMDKHGFSPDTVVINLPNDKRELIQNEYKEIKRNRRILEEPSNGVNFSEVHSSTGTLQIEANATSSNSVNDQIDSIFMKVWRWFVNLFRY